MSVKNNTAILVSHIQREYKIIAKTIHYAMDVSTIKAKLFTIRCGISQAPCYNLNFMCEVKDILLY